jgi:metal-responsive CopG/Arc/MetJ family transcriptional regulator
MAVKAVQISMDTDLLRRIDAQPETHAHGRSAFVRTAVERLLRARKRQEIDRAISRAFADDAEAMQDEVDSLVDAQTWPED